MTFSNILPRKIIKLEGFRDDNALNKRIEDVKLFSQSLIEKTEEAIRKGVLMPYYVNNNIAYYEARIQGNPFNNVELDIEYDNNEGKLLSINVNTQGLRPYNIYITTNTNNIEKE